MLCLDFVFFPILHEKFSTKKIRKLISFFLFFVANLYTNIENWPDVKSLPAQLGQIGGIALTNGNNELVVFYRGSRTWDSK